MVKSPSCQSNSSPASQERIVLAELYGTKPIFTTVTTEARSRAILIQSAPPHPVSFKADFNFLKPSGSFRYHHQFQH
jgi:hypothetical protein